MNRPPLLGFTSGRTGLLRVPLPPLHRHATERPLPHAPCGSCFGSEGTTLEIPFRPRGFAPPRRFPPLGGRGLVASRCQSWGSSRFVLSGSQSAPGRIQLPSGVPTPSPRRFSHPSKDSPRRQPHHVTVAVAPLPFPLIPLRTSNRLRCQSRPSMLHGTAAPASRPCSAIESVTSARSLPTGRRPLLPGLRSPSRSFLTTRRTLVSRAAPACSRPPEGGRSQPAAPSRHQSSTTIPRDRCRPGKHSQRRSADGPRTKVIPLRGKAARSRVPGADDESLRRFVDSSLIGQARSA